MPRLVPEASSRSRAVNGVVTTVSLAILLVLWGARWPLRSRFPYEWDSASYVLGADHFDVYRHHPHPPGYPLYILILKGMRLFTTDLNRAQVVLAFVFTSAAVALTHQLGRRYYGAAGALFAASLVLFSPPVILYNCIASTYPIDLLTSALIGSLAARLWTGEKSVGPWAAFALGALAGFRESGALLMMPLALAALARAYRRDVVGWARCAAVGGATVAAWYLPTAWMHGGIPAYQRFCNHTIHGYFSQLSILCGAPASMHIGMLVNVIRWSAMALAVANLVTCAVWATGRVLRSSHAPPPWSSQASSADIAAFFGLWIAPNATYVTLFQCVKPGYLVLSLPPLMFLFGGLVAASFNELAARMRVKGVTVGAATACFAGLASWGLACHHFHNASFQRSSLASVVEGDEETRAMRALIEGGAGGSDHVMAIYFSWPWYGPTPQSMLLQYPHAAIAIVSPDGMTVHRNAEVFDERGDRRQVPSDVQYLLWISEADRPLPGGVFAAFPATHQVYSGRKTAVFLTELSEPASDSLLASALSPLR